MIQLVYEQVAKAKHLDELVVATDDSRIYEHVLGFGGAVMMTSAEHQSGTDRIAELTEKNPHWDLIINVQGDEPFINKEPLAAVLKEFQKDEKKDIDLASLMFEISDWEAIQDPNNVKVIVDQNNFALYFSRSVIPYARDKNGGVRYFQHIGIYAFRKQALLDFAKLPMKSLEASEKLEQLRYLEYGKRIKMIETTHRGIGIDTPADLEKARLMLK